MNALPITINLEIPNDPERISEFTKTVLTTVQEHVALDLGYQRRIKLIMIELITNSIKHSEETSTTIQMTIDHPHLSIQKIEKGLKIEFSASSPQIPFEEIDAILNVSFSDVNRHHIQPLDKYKFKFLKPSADQELTIDHIPEHFGLYIITMASDSFIYQYNPDLGENSFIVHLNF
ncbi:MAG: hypothetical protein V4687_01730 [Bacteroidota bacterium]